MAGYTNSERVDMLRAYFQSDESSLQARLLYTERYPNRRIPNERTFVSNVQHLRDNGSFHSRGDRGRQKTDRVLNIVPQILDHVDQNPGTSSRRIANQFHVSPSTVLRCLHEQGLYPYHVQKVQALQPEDPVRRRTYCEWLVNKCQENINFLNTVLWTDEAGFTREGVFNTHNTHIWADENPHAIRESHFQTQFSLNVWAGIIGNKLIGPYFLPQRLNGEMYLHFISDVLDGLLDDIPLATRRRMWLMQDGAPPHSTRVVTAWLNNEYPERWIGRYGPVSWPPRSPDLNPCDFFLWGHMKQLVYATPVNSIEELRVRIENAAETIRQDPEMLNRVRDNVTKRAEACNANGGQHFEQLL